MDTSIIIKPGRVGYAFLVGYDAALFIPAKLRLLGERRDNVVNHV